MNSETANRYVPEGSEVRTEHVDEVRILTATGRFGTIRYLAYVASVGIVGGFLVATTGVILRAFPEPLAHNLYLLANLAFLLSYGVLLTLLTIMRLHDVNRSGWFAVLVVPLAPILIPILCFIPGTRTSNRFGQVPLPNTRGEKFLGTIYFIAMVLAFAFIMIAFSSWTSALLKSLSA